MTSDYDWHTPPSATGASSRLTVATCQTLVTHDLDQNLAHIIDLIRRAALAGADVAHFPECALSGYGPAAWPDWDGFRMLDEPMFNPHPSAIWIDGDVREHRELIS